MIDSVVVMPVFGCRTKEDVIVVVRHSGSLLITASVFLLGCGEGTDEGVGGPEAGPSATAARTPTGPGDGPRPPAPVASPGAAGVPPKPVPIAAGTVALTPENTSIGFVGTHAGGPPNPRVGGFERFTGTAEVDAASKALKSASVEIQTDSLWTPIPQLTTHLKSPDFFDAREHPAARFKSTSISTDGAKTGEYTIKGDLTLLETTKPVSFPAKVEISDAGLTLTGSFTLDRTEFGMDRVQDRVQKEVTVTIAVGKKTEPLAATGGFGGGPRGGPGRRGGPGGPGGGGGRPAGPGQP